MLVLKAPQALRGSSRSDFAAGSVADAFRGLSVSSSPGGAPARAPLRVDALHGVSGRKCMLTGKKANNGYTVSFSHRRTKTLQQPNLQYKRLYWAKEERWIRLRISTNAMKTVEKVGLEKLAAEAGLDLYSLPFQDASEARRAWVAANPAPPQPLAKRAPKFRPLGLAKPAFIPAWKTAKLAALPEAARALALTAFKAKHHMTAA